MLIFLITFIQNEEKFKTIIDDYACGDMEINYWEEEDNDYYSYGKIVITEKWDSSKNRKYHYVIELKMNSNSWGYCQCQPTDVNYNEKHHCCGTSCDWDQPSFEAKKIVYLDHGEYKGFERDLWETEKLCADKINGYKEEKRNQDVFEIEQEIKRLENRKSKLLKGEEL